VILDGEVLVVADFRAVSIASLPLAEALASCPLEVVDRTRDMAAGFTLFQVTRAGATMHPQDTAAWCEISSESHAALLTRLASL